MILVKMSNYQTLVSAMPKRVRDDRSLLRPLVIVSWDVQLCYVQSDVRGGTGFPPRVLDRRAFPCRAEHRSAPSPAIVSSMLDDMRLPFLLDRLWWLDLGAAKNATKKRLTRDELASEIARVASEAVNSSGTEGRKKTEVEVRMTHKVMISEREFREMRAQLRRLELQYLHFRMLQEEERGRRFPILERRFLLNLMRQEGLAANPDPDMEDVWRRRVMRESLDPAAINFEAARESIIQSLNVVVSEGDQGSSGHELSCAICIEEVAIGDLLVRMDCSHEFHKNCIETWLRIHHSCPLCRCKLPTEKS